MPREFSPDEVHLRKDEKRDRDACRRMRLDRIGAYRASADAARGVGRADGDGAKGAGKGAGGDRGKQGKRRNRATGSHPGNAGDAGDPGAAGDAAAWPLSPYAPPPPWRRDATGWSRRTPPPGAFDASGDALVTSVRVSAGTHGAVGVLVARLTLAWGHRATQAEAVAALVAFAEARGVDFQRFVLDELSRTT